MRQAKIVFKKYLLQFYQKKASIMSMLVVQIIYGCLMSPTQDFYDVIYINFLIQLTAIIAVLQIIGQLVVEKQKKSKDYELINGLSLKSYYLGTILSSSFTTIIWAIFNQLIVLICLRYINDIYFSMDSLYFLFECLFYSISIASYMLCLSSLFLKNLDILLILIIIILFIMNYYIMEQREKFWAILLQRISPINLIFTRYFHYVAPKPNDLSVLQTLIIFSIQSFFGFLLYIYFDQVIPNQNKTHKNIFFFFKYLKCKRKVEVNMSELELNDNISNVQNLLEDHQINEQFDRISMVQIDSLVEIFKNQKVVINNFNLNLYNNELMCLLGHNGSGKSTIIKLISGVIKKNSGVLKTQEKVLGFFSKETISFIISVYMIIQDILHLEDQTQLEIKIDNLLSILMPQFQSYPINKYTFIYCLYTFKFNIRQLQFPNFIILASLTDISYSSSFWQFKFLQYSDLD